MKRKVSTILAADVVGYSRLMGKDDAGTLSLLKACEVDLIEPTVTKHNGRIFKRMGDGYLAEFSSAIDGVNCALDWQAQSNMNDGSKLKFRIGLHAGDVIEEAEDVYGDSVNVAARLQAMAQPGCIAISDQIFSQVHNEVDVKFDDLGEQDLKNIPHPVHVLEWRSAFVLPRRLRRGDLELPKKSSIVILPFRNLTGEEKHEILAEGLRADIQSALTQVSGVFLIAMGAANQFRGAAPDEAGPALGVQYALQCSVRSAGARIRMIAELKDSKSGALIWAETYDRTLDDTFALQDEITERILTAMNVKIIAGEQAKIWHKSLKSYKAHEYFYKGLDAFYQMNRDDIVIARNYFENVSKLEPDSALGPMQVAMCYWYDLQKGWSQPVEPIRKSTIEWAEKAAQKDDEDGQALTVLSHVHLINGDYDAALKAGRAATSTRPGCANSNAYFANVLHHCGDDDEAIRHIKLAMRFNPLNPPLFRNILSASYLAKGDLEGAIEIAEETLSIAAADITSRLQLASAYEHAQQHNRARQFADEVLEIDPGFSLEKFADAQFYRNRGYVEQLTETLRAAGLPN
ncbi:MAG: tetratricopeptide repeat protein [Hyphomicrobiales bacterium]